MKKVLFFVTTLSLFYSCNESNGDTDSKAGHKDVLEKEIDELLSEMTIEEKVGQTCQITLDVLLEKDSAGLLKTPIEINEEALKMALFDYHVGSILNVGWCTLSRDEWHTVMEAVHKPYMNKELSIPIIYGIDAIHGMNYAKEATLFPQEIGLAATWNNELAKQFGEITAYETRACGIPWNFSPVLDIARQPLWSRTFETLGEDPYLIAQMGASIVKGYQGTNQPIDDKHVVACLKHYVGYSASHSGRDRTPAFIPKQQMHELHLPGFKKAIEEGALTVMINSGVVNGTPGHTNYHLLTEVLKEEWGFEGFTVSDWEDFIMLHTVHKTDSSLKEAYISAFNAGVDMSMVPLSPNYIDYCENMVEAVNEGRISMKRLDDAVRRILRVKKRVNLFKDTYSNKKFDKYASDEFKNAAKDAALESITLLKNNGILPLSEDKKVLVAGPTSNDLIFLNGAWTHTWQGSDPSFNTKGCLNVKEAMEKRIGDHSIFSQAAELFKENHFEQTKFVDLNDYKSKLKRADVVMLCLGEYPSTEKPGDILSLNLNEEQLELAKIAYAMNKEVILVLLEGRPRIIREIVPEAAAIVQCYLPGDYGAEALIELIYGDQNFSGRLPYTYPKYDGVIEFYDHPKSVARDNNQGFDAFNPQWEFGYGLSYSKVSYSDITINNDTLSSAEDSIHIEVRIKNIGDSPMKEVVQLYLTDHYASSTPALKKLKRFKKISLDKREEINISFSLNINDLFFVNEKGEYICENGWFTATVGGQSVQFLLNI